MGQREKGEPDLYHLRDEPASTHDLEGDGATLPLRPRVGRTHIPYPGIFQHHVRQQGPSQ